MDPDRETPAGTTYETFPSRTIDGRVSFLIYRPPGYETAPEQRYPVVYWLHGLGGTQRGCAGFVKRLDAAIQAGKAPEMLVVGVNGLGNQPVLPIRSTASGPSRPSSSRT